MKAALQRVMLEGGELRTGPDGVTTIGQFRDARAGLDQERSGRIERYKRFKASEEESLKRAEKKRMGGRSRWQDIKLNAKAYEDIRDRFADREFTAQRRPAGRGFLATLLDWLFPTVMRPDIRNQVATL